MKNNILFGVNLSPILNILYENNYAENAKNVEKYLSNLKGYILLEQNGSKYFGVIVENIKNSERVYKIEDIRLNLCEVDRKFLINTEWVIEDFADDEYECIPIEDSRRNALKDNN